MMQRLPILSSMFITISLVILAANPVKAQNVRDGVENLAKQIIEGMPGDKETRVVVVDFPDLLNITSNLGRYVANRLTTRLAQSDKFFVVERQRLGQVLAELKFSMSDLIDPEKAKELGKMVGVEAMVVGTISDLGSQVDLDARLIEIESRRMLLSATTTISKEQVVAQLMERGRTAAPSPSTESAPPSASSPQPVTASAGESSRIFQNSFLRVTPMSVSMNKDKSQISLVLQFENLAKENILLAIVGKYGKFDSRLTDDKGNLYRASEFSGLSTVSKGYDHHIDYYAKFTPSSKYTVVMIFAADEGNENVDATYVSFSADCMRYTEKSQGRGRRKRVNGFGERFSIGIANMRLQ